MADSEINGRCDARFRAVRDAFRANFAQHGERGGAVTIAFDGRVVVDLWGGWSDIGRARHWQEDTIVNAFSVGKAVNAIAVLRLVERGLLDLDAPVAAVWPEFAAATKSQITTRMVLSHRAGLPALRAPLPDGAMLDWARITMALADETPWWTPDSAHGYHVNTFGFITGEIVRRVSGRTIGTVLRDDIAGPMALDFHIGLPASEHARCAEFLWPGNPPRPEIDSDDALMRWNAYWNPPGFSGGGWVNSPEWRLAEIPSTNSHTNARSIARLYAALIDPSRRNAMQILSADMLGEAMRAHSVGIDLISQRPIRFGLGFQLTQPERPLGPNPNSFGHFGAGGSLGFCDPDTGLAFGYVTNDMGPRWQNPRNGGLIAAAYACL